MPVKCQGFEFIKPEQLKEAIEQMDSQGIPAIVQGMYPELETILGGPVNYQIEEEHAIQHQDEINDAIFMLTAAFIAGASMVCFTFGQFLHTGLVKENSSRVITGLETYNKS